MYHYIGGVNNMTIVSNLHKMFLAVKMYQNFGNVSNFYCVQFAKLPQNI